MTQNEAAKEFQDIFKQYIKREGAEKMLEYIKSTDFFTAPASTKFHSNHAGGLVEHHVKVFRRFAKMVECEYGAEYMKNPERAESVAIIALLHDICKVGCYKTETRNVKNDETGVWEKKPFFAFDDPLPYGHGEKSVYMICGYMKLTREEAMAINWHMGAFDERSVGGRYPFSAAFHMFPLALLFHAADLLTSYLDEKITK